MIVTMNLSAGSTNTSLDAAMTIDPMPLLHQRGRDDSINQATEDMQVFLTKEPETGILFSPIFDSKRFLGCGVRKKYQFFNLYAVGFYFDAQDFQGIHDEEGLEKALLDPHNHRTVRIVFNRALTMKQVIDTLRDSLEPRMNGQDLHS
jgi:hypothetical protein